MDKSSQFSLDNKLVYLKGHNTWKNYLGSSVKYEADKVYYVHYSNELQEFSSEICYYNFKTLALSSFKDYLERRIKIYKMFNNEDKIEISKLVSLYNLRSPEHKFHQQWWTLTY